MITLKVIIWLLVGLVVLGLVLWGVREIVRAMALPGVLVTVATIVGVLLYLLWALSLLGMV